LKVRERIVLASYLGQFVAASAPAFTSNPDVPYFVRSIVTVDAGNPNAEAVAIKAGKIVAVGTRTAVETTPPAAALRIQDSVRRLS